MGLANRENRVPGAAFGPRSGPPLPWPILFVSYRQQRTFAGIGTVRNVVCRLLDLYCIWGSFKDS